MGLIPHKYRDGQLDPWEAHPAASGIMPQIGLALKFASGKLAKASGADNIDYICMEQSDVATTAGQMLHVIAVDGDTIYETTLSAAVTSIAAGNTYNLDTNGTALASTTGGALKVIDFDGNQAGDTARVQIVKVAAG